MSKLIQVIETISKRGKGVPGDPVRVVTEYWTTDGILLAEVDPEAPKLIIGLKAREGKRQLTDYESCFDLWVGDYLCGQVWMDTDTRDRLIKQTDGVLKL